MAEINEEKTEAARKLMDDFSRRTGLQGNQGDKTIRYLWTDAFAVQTFFGLSNALNDNSYRKKALVLIELVHENLGRFHPDDDRKGWISGLGLEEGNEHPTAGGLRIGKKLPERQPDEPFNERLEWERDGQYFHYITRWVNALLQAEQETGEKNYGIWAAELLLASRKFIKRAGGAKRMYWKMSVDLSRPLVPSMGAHDPLEGLICTKSAQEAAPERVPELVLLERDFAEICAGQNWATFDPLGIGGLLLNSIRAADLAASEVILPVSVNPEKLWKESMDSLKGYADTFFPQAASQRLAFRECGLSLGLRAAYGMKDLFRVSGFYPEELSEYLPLAEELENFWIDPAAQRSPTWKDHLDINAVSLAASIVAANDPSAFSGARNYL